MDLSKIRAFAFDIDGVATDGGVFCFSDGDLLRTYDAKDGFAIRMAVMNGYPVAVITGGSSESIRKRMVTSGVKPDDVYLGSRIKTEQLHAFCEKYGILPENVLYVGDDVPDMDAMIEAGILTVSCIRSRFEKRCILVNFERFLSLFLYGTLIQVQSGRSGGQMVLLVA